MIERICAYIHNFFTATEDMHEGTYTIENGSIELPFLLYGQYFRIIGSALNDGVYQYPASGLANETFKGEIWAMKVPKGVLDIAEEAEAIETQYITAMNSPYTSESFNGYSYTKAAGASSGINNWLFGNDGLFGARLNQWRKLA